jgi:hydrophobic/amphiphilic exporter-1 (mainly G- bacteria), HAE1 family
VTPPRPRVRESPEMAAKADIGGSAAGFTALFVRRPIMALVLNSLIVIAGLAAIFGVEVRELPDVDNPVITVTTTYEGAAPETVDREVTDIIEGAMGRISGVSEISSRSTVGRSRVTVEFNDSTDLDAAASDARDAIGRILNQLPDDADEPRVVKADANAEAVIRIGVTSSTMPIQDLTELVETTVSDRLIAAPGVADVQIYGGRERIFRVDVDQLALASRGLTIADVREALATVAFDSPAGSLTASNQSLVVRTTATVDTPDAFEALMLDHDTRLSDVATVTLGPDTGDSILRSNGQSGLGVGIIRQAQSNTLAISKSIHAIVADLDRTLPDNVSIFVTSDDAAFITGALHEVVRTLVLSVLIVVAIIYLFLRDWRATLIPTLTIPVALIGTLAAIYLVGFSVNILTLLALVLSTGLVVDDAIVVLENIVRRRGQGMGPRAAAVLGTRQVFFAVVATTATLAAVFVPLSFLPGQTGALFREFGITLAMSVIISTLVALSLCPMLASRLLRAGEPASHGPGPALRIGSWLERAYHRVLRAALNAPLLVLTIAAVFGATAILMTSSIRQELTPPEDRAVAVMQVSTPQGVSLDYTASKMREIEDRVRGLRASGEVVGLFSIAGFNGQDNSGFMIFTLAPWDERTRSQQEIVADINAATGSVIGVRAFANQPNSLGIRGAGQGLQFAILGNNYDTLAAAAEALVAKLEANPAFGQVRLSYETTQPQLFIRVDRERASDLGIDIDGLGETLQSVLDGTSVGSVFIDDESYDIKLISTTNPVRDPTDLEGLFLQTAAGEMVPMSTVVTLEERPIAPELRREAQMRSVSITAGLDGLALGEAYGMVQDLAAPLLPPEARIVPLAEAATLDETSNGIFITFGFALLVVFLVLAAEFESFVSAAIVMATVPFGLACAVVAMVLTGVSLNVYSQIGLVLLVGIVAKNGILIVEFANQLRDGGAGVRAAIEEACRIRLRPVMMTMAATVLAGVPLVMSSGAGAEAREALGWVIVGGLGLATVLTLFLTPVAFLLLAGLSKPRAEESRRLAQELSEVGAGAEGLPPAE